MIPHKWFDDDLNISLYMYYYITSLMSTYTETMTHKGIIYVDIYGIFMI